MVATIADFAATYVRKYGFSLVPLPPGAKRPLSDNWGNECITDPEQARSYYERRPSANIGVALGPSRLCSLDIDDLDAMRTICAEFGWDIDALAQSAPTIQGRAPGFRIMFRVPDGLELPYHSLTWPRQDDAGKRFTVFEIRSATDQQRQDVLPPSIHPDTGKPYVWLTKPNGTIPDPPAWLLALWQNWAALKPQLQGLCPWAPQRPTPKPPKAPARPANDSTSPSVIDAYERAHSIEAALTQYGYKQQGKRWLSPHSGTGLAGVILFDGKAWIHHASDPLCSDESGQLVSSFDLFRFYEHGGDIRKAVKAAAEALGMKPEPRMPTIPAGAVAQRPQAGPAVQGSEVIDADTGEIEPIPPEFSDDSLALEFVAQFGAGLRWSPGLGWMHDEGTHWKRDDHLIRFDLARKTARTVAMLADQKIRKPITSAKTVNALLFLAQSDPDIVVPAAQWDNDPLMLNTPDGLVDLRTGKTHQRNRQQYLTQLCRVSPDAGKKTEHWLRFVSQVFVDDADTIEFVQRMCGYCLSGDRREQKLFFAHGQGSNGKSTLLDILMWIMGTYALKLPTTALMASRNERHPTELAQLHGKRLAVSNELEEGSFWAEARIKELTGDETLTARFMRQDNFTFTMSHKHLIAGNHKPRLKGGDPAMARRMVLVPFLQKFEGAAKDAKLPEKLKAEAPGIMAWAIEGARKWYADGLAIPGSVEDASRDYMAEHDDIAMWIEECCKTDAGTHARSSDLYASFRRWKQSRGEHEPSQTVWGEKMTLVPGLRKVKMAGIMTLKGIDLNATEKARNQGLP
jgi:putative DNA primase/helicase